MSLLISEPVPTVSGLCWAFERERVRELVETYSAPQSAFMGCMSSSITFQCPKQVTTSRSKSVGWGCILPTGKGWRRKANVYWIPRASVSLFCWIDEAAPVFISMSISKIYNDPTCTSQCTLGESQMSRKQDTWECMLIWHQGANVLPPCTLEARKGTEVILSAFSSMSVSFGGRRQQEGSTHELNDLPLASISLPFWCIYSVNFHRSIHLINEITPS